ncbi:MAG: class I SAM-dependent methyltransferase [Pseudomonadota bacterium]
MNATYERKDCRLCRSTDLVRVMDFPATPPGNQFLQASELDQPEETYDLYVMHCQNCGHLQLGLVVDPRILYQRDYKYVSGTSPVFRKHFEDYADWVTSEYDIKPDSFVVDVGSNDGTCLGFFKNKGYRVLGVDPATEIAEAATAGGIPTIADFFSRALAEDIRAKHGAADLITSHNACAHVDQLEDLILGVRDLLADDGVFVFEVGYAVDVYDNAYFDTIYHEHVDYHTVKPFTKFFNRLDMTVIDVTRVSAQGGSIRVAVKKNTSDNITIGPRVQECLDLEDQRNFDDPNTFREFAMRIAAIGAELKGTLEDLLAAGHRVAAYGAPTKSTTLLSHFGINKNHIEYIVDDNKKKQGLFSPVHHIPIMSKQHLFDNRPDYLVVLAWNFAESIIENNKEFSDGGGKFIVPMPEVRICS